MLYRILAHSRDNGQRMTLEVDAKSKADAERQAQRQNLQIIRIEAVTADAQAPAEMEWTTLKPRRSFKIPWLLIFLLIAGGAIYYFWPTIASLLHDHIPQTTRPTAAPEP